MEELINYKIWTVCMIQDGENVLMLNRQHDNFKGISLLEAKLIFLKVSQKAPFVKCMKKLVYA